MEQQMQMASSMEEIKNNVKLVETRNKLGTFPVTNHTEDNLLSGTSAPTLTGESSSAIDRIAALR